MYSTPVYHVIPDSRPNNTLFMPCTLYSDMTLSAGPFFSIRLFVIPPTAAPPAVRFIFHSTMLVRCLAMHCPSCERRATQWGYRCAQGLSSSRFEGNQRRNEFIPQPLENWP